MVSRDRKKRNFQPHPVGIMETQGHGISANGTNIWYASLLAYGHMCLLSVRMGCLYIFENDGVPN
jgi:hypothetical protein